jgi:hypothetical protein
MARAIPQKQPKPAFVEEVHLLDGHALRVYEAMDGEIVGGLCGPLAEGVHLGGTSEAELIELAMDWLRMHGESCPTIDNKEVETTSDDD